MDTTLTPFPHSRPGPPRGWRAAAFALCSLLLVGLAGCGPSQGDEAAAQVAAARDAEWAWLQQAKQDLDRRRAERGVPAEAPGAGDAAQREAQRAALQAEIDQRAEELGRRLIAFINADPPVAGEPLTGRQQAAIRLKSDEDLWTAREAIERAGDYQRAIAIYESALAVDPDNQKLKEALEQARARRYMTRELFSQVKEGMRQEEVRALLGQPNLHDVREYPERGVVAWFYPKDASGAAAGVWFETKGGVGGATVYLLDFNAITPRNEPPPAPVSGGVS